MALSPRKPVCGHRAPGLDCTPGESGVIWGRTWRGSCWGSLGLRPLHPWVRGPAVVFICEAAREVLAAHRRPPGGCPCWRSTSGRPGQPPWVSLFSGGPWEAWPCPPRVWWGLSRFVGVGCLA